MGPIDTNISDANHVVLYAQNDTWGFGPMEISNSGSNHPVLHARNDGWGLGPMETSNSAAKVAVLHAKTIQNDACILVPAFICGFASKTATFGSELQVTMGPSPHMCFLHAKQRLFDRNYKSLWIPDFACWLLHAKQRAKIQNDSCLLVPAFIGGFCVQNRDYRTRITSLYGSQPSSVVFTCKTVTFGSEPQVTMGPSPHLLFLHAKQRLLDQN